MHRINPVRLLPVFYDYACAKNRHFSAFLNCLNTHHFFIYMPSINEKPYLDKI